MNPVKILFVCHANVDRSQMAEALFRTFAREGGEYEAMSAGTHVLENEGKPLADEVVRCMKELGYDLSGSRRKQLTPQMVDEANKVVVMTSFGDVPWYLHGSPKMTYWDVPDGKGKSYEGICAIRNQIRDLIQTLF
ncbi:MAG: low molecular weight phosphatase family protein [Candidatus Aenigmatarchaeota archaeon]